MKTLKEVATLLDVCRQTLSKMIDTDQIKIITIRNKKMISDEEIERLNIGSGTLKAAEAATELRVCRATIYNMIADGELATVPVSLVTRIPITEIERIKREGTK